MCKTRGMVAGRKLKLHMMKQRMVHNKSHLGVRMADKKSQLGMIKQRMAEKKSHLDTSKPKWGDIKCKKHYIGNEWRPHASFRRPAVNPVKEKFNVEKFKKVLTAMFNPRTLRSATVKVNGVKRVIYFNENN